MIKDNISVSDKLSFGINKGQDDQIRIDVNCIVELFDENGNLKEKREVHNTVTTAGKYGIAAQILAAPDLNKIGWAEVGTGTGGTTKLNAYIAGSRTAFTSKTRANNVISTSTSFAAGVGTGAITEAGTFDVITENTENMWMYATFAVVNKAAADSLTLTWTLTIS